MSTTNNCLRPTAFMDFYVEGGLLYHFDGVGTVFEEPNYEPGTFYVYRIGMDLMDGQAMGYNHMGNGAFFHPTVPVPASLTPELNWLRDNGYSDQGFLATSVNRILDRSDRPSIALSRGLSGPIIHQDYFTITANYLSGNVLSGKDTRIFPTGNVSDIAVAAWGELSTPDPAIISFGSTVPEGPLRVEFTPDHYTTASLQIEGELRRQKASDLVFLPSTGPSATQYLDEIGYTPSPPAKWILRMAIGEKLSGKTKWLYPPLDRYADVNGDGVLDAADLIAVNRMPDRKQREE
ncbi:hypothetical protein BH09SUM1_BH09SUM1_22960 [soil metagenome]